MKFLAALSFTISVTMTAGAQLSAKLDSTVFFSSIQFGKPIPESLLKDCPKAKHLLNYEYSLSTDNLDAACKEKYADMLNFYGTGFSYVGIITNNKKQVYLIRLSRRLEPTDSIDASNIKYPLLIDALYDSLVSVFGKPGQVINETPPENANYNGLRQIIIWEGYHTSFWVYVQFGPDVGWHELRVDIKSNKYEDMPEQERLLNP